MPTEGLNEKRWPHFENCGMAETTMPCACLRRRAARERELSAENERLRDRMFDVQQECARLDFTNRGEDKTAKWVAEQLIAALHPTEETEGENDAR